MSYAKPSKIGWITAYKVNIRYDLGGGNVVELTFSPSLFDHEPWACNPNSPYGCEPKQLNYAPGCPAPTDLFPENLLK
jgi:hypothetical protein